MNKRSWYLISLFNLALVALLGCALRSKIVFYIPWIDHKNLINAHSHFAFGGWISLSFLALFTKTLLPLENQNRPWYQHMLWGIQISSMGMLLSFPFQGYGGISILFSTLFIFFTYGYTWRFLKDIFASKKRGPETILAVAALTCLVLSSAGPFALAYILASGSSNAILYKDAVYYYLHFQYNGFFTLAVFALLAARLTTPSKTSGNMQRFAVVLAASIIPSFFLTLLWHPGNPLVRFMAITGVLLLTASLFYFFRLLRDKPALNGFSVPVARTLCRLVFISFVIKIVLQAGTIIPDLGHAVFGLRPIIIGFLHLVFLGLASFYILSEYTERAILQPENALTGSALKGFILAVIAQESVLLIQGGGLLLGRSNPLYNWILWGLSIFLFIFALLMSITALKNQRPEFVPKRKSGLGINL